MFNLNLPRPLCPNVMVLVLVEGVVMVVGVGVVVASSRDGGTGTSGARLNVYVMVELVATIS